METVKVRNLAEPVFSKVSDIQPGKSGYNLYLKVETKTILIDRKRIDESRVVICDFLVGDETGMIKMRIRNEKYVDMLKEGDSIIVRNCKVPVINNHIRLQVDAFGKIEISTEVKVNEVKKDKNLSNDVYDHFASKSRFNPKSKGKSYNQNQSFKAKSIFSDSVSDGTFLSSKN